MSETTPARKTAAKKTASKVSAAKAEAKNAPIVFEFKGLSFKVPTDPRQFPLEILETDDELEATRLILGDDQWAAFRATGPTVGDFYDLTEAMSEARGRDTDSGN
ncbi:hypothetical protein AB0E08_03585 [Streptomyces sp. NPDC048281]|uniref:hypothetical protein n=1 Tax=Streptomyces sp. NPDC048281 TaxID=3154715 RepID=UPI00342A3D48